MFVCKDNHIFLFPPIIYKKNEGVKICNYTAPRYLNDFSSLKQAHKNQGDRFDSFRIKNLSPSDSSFSITNLRI